MQPPSGEFQSIWSFLDNLSFEQRFIDVGGIKTRFIHAGPPNAPKVVMLHGTGGSWENHCANIAATAKYFDCYALDMAGNGYSDRPDMDYEVPFYVEHLKGFLSALDIKRTSIMGVSLGSWVAARFAVSYPDLTEKLTLVSPAGLLLGKDNSARIKAGRTKAVEDPSWENIQEIFDKLIKQPEKRMADLIALRQRLYRLPDSKKAMEHILCLQEPDIRARNLITEDEWRSIKSPALVFAHVDAPDIYLDTAYRVSELMPHARCVEIRNAGHWGQFEECEFYNQINLEFLRER